MPIVRSFAHYGGLTWCLSFGGMLLAAFGQRRLAGLAWFGLGAGAVGVAFARVTDKKELRFENVRRQLNEEEIDFLFGHLPYLALGLVTLLDTRSKRDALI
jgi:hypothetical protein